MANYGRGWGNETSEEQAEYDDKIALQEGDWNWLEKSPRQQRLRQEQGITDGSYAEDKQ